MWTAHLAKIQRIPSNERVMPTFRPAPYLKRTCPARSAFFRRTDIDVSFMEMSRAIYSPTDIVPLYLDQIAALTQKLDELHFKLRAATKVDDAMRRLCTVPGAIMAFAPDLRAFASVRNFADWLGLVPRPGSTGGKDAARREGSTDRCVCVEVGAQTMRLTLPCQTNEL